MNMLQTKKEELKKQGKKGFTLMELLIVVAIIAVLVAIAIPVFTSQLEKSKESTDAANIRSAYAEVMAEALTQTTPAEVTRTVTLKQSQAGWQTNPAPDLAGSSTITGTGRVTPTVTGAPAVGGTCTVTWTPASGTNVEGTVAIAFSAGA